MIVPLNRYQTIHSLHSFIYSLLTQQDCVLPVVTVRKYCFHFSRVLGSVVDYINANLSARVAVNHALRNAQNMCALAKVGTVKVTPWEKNPP